MPAAAQPVVRPTGRAGEGYRRGHFVSEPGVDALQGVPGDVLGLGREALPPYPHRVQDD